MSGKKILVVDDDKDQLLALAITLKAKGYVVVSAMDAVSAISMARKERPDLVLLDLGLPAGDGFVVMERLKNLIPLATIPVVIVTARDLACEPRALSAGATAFLQKPVENDLLLATVQRALD
jgi:CheY-like chemotaxis protein